MGGMIRGTTQIARRPSIGAGLDALSLRQPSPLRGYGWQASSNLERAAKRAARRSAVPSEACSAKEGEREGGLLALRARHKDGLRSSVREQAIAVI